MNIPSNTILAMDDSKLIQQLWQLLAKNIGYRCLAVPTPHNALEALRDQTQCFCALFLDIWCPGAIPGTPQTGSVDSVDLEKYGGLNLALILRDERYRQSLSLQLPEHYLKPEFPVFALSSETDPVILDHFKKCGIPVLAKNRHLKVDGVETIKTLLNHALSQHLKNPVA